MEIHRRKNSSGDKFSFPVIPIQDQDFEFGCATPGSPNSPADRLFSNGKLLPHAFPCQPTNNTLGLSRSTSRTSVCSKDSLMSSRSNSTNSSRSSSCSSARTSTSEAAGAGSCASDRKLSSNNQVKISSKNPVEKDRYQATKKAVLTPHYGSSQRWQFIAPAPTLKHQVSRARKAKNIAVRDQECKSMKQSKDWTIARRTWFGLKFFRAFVSACKECHAIKPSSRKSIDKKKED